MKNLLLIVLGATLMFTACQKRPETYQELESMLSAIDAQGADTMRCLIQSAEFLVDEKAAYYRMRTDIESNKPVAKAYYNLVDSIRNEKFIDVSFSIKFQPSCLPAVGVEDTPLTALIISANDDSDRARIENLRYRGVGLSVFIKVGDTKILPSFSSFENFPGLSGVDRFLIRFPDKSKILEALSQNDLEVVIDNLLPETGMRVLKIGEYDRLFGE